MADAPLVLSSDSLALTTLQESVAAAQHYAGLARAGNTKRAYESDWRDFQAFCQARNESALPAKPEIVGAYLGWLAMEQQRKPATIARRLAAISKMHALHKLDLPTRLQHAAVGDTLRGIRREKGTRQIQKAPVVVDVLRSMLRLTPRGRLIGLRDRALLLIGFAAALRRSELVALQVEDVEYRTQGVVLTVRRSKSDQEGAGAEIAIAMGGDPKTCPIRALTAWLEASGITTGPIFRSVNLKQQLGAKALTDQVVADVVKRYASKLNLDPAAFAGHSLRAGLATSAAQAGALERDIMRQTRHKSEAMVRRYIREANVFKGNVSGLIGL